MITCSQTGKLAGKGRNMNQTISCYQLPGKSTREMAFLAMVLPSDENKWCQSGVTL